MKRRDSSSIEPSLQHAKSGYRFSAIPTHRDATFIKQAADPPPRLTFYASGFMAFEIALAAQILPKLQRGGSNQKDAKSYIEEDPL